MKTVYYVAASMDGFIADIDGGVSWLDKLNIDHQANGCESFFKTVDGVVMGRRTFDFVYGYGQWPYEDKPAWVCTSREMPHMDKCNLQSERAAVAAIRQAEGQNVKTLWVVGGGQLVGALIRDRLLTHISVAVMPILLGNGIRLVHSLPNPLHLRQVNSTSMSGFTQLEYELGS